MEVDLVVRGETLEVVLDDAPQVALVVVRVLAVELLEDELLLGAREADAAGGGELLQEGEVAIDDEILADEALLELLEKRGPALLLV